MSKAITNFTYNLFLYALISGVYGAEPIEIKLLKLKALGRNAQEARVRRGKKTLYQVYLHRFINFSANV